MKVTKSNLESTVRIFCKRNGLTFSPSCVARANEAILQTESNGKRFSLHIVSKDHKSITIPDLSRMDVKALSAKDLDQKLNDMMEGQEVSQQLKGGN